MNYLIFQLYGPLASWGAPAVGESRPTSDHPGRSALIGLVAAALGVRRDDAPTQESLGRSLQFGVKQLTPGTLMKDFHTVQVPKRNRNVRYATRKAELALPGHRLNTIISRREYRCDGLWYIAISITPQSDWTLAEISDSLRYPVFTLYLGRKSCPVSAPLAPQIVEASGLAEAFSSVHPGIHGQQSRWLGLNDVVDYFWEGESSDIEIQNTRFPDDDVVSRARWQFKGRAEHHARVREAS